MPEIIVERQTVNIPALDQAARAALGDAVVGVSRRPGAAVIHLIADATRGQIEQARQIMLEHDPSLLTTEQTAEARRIQRLQAARQNNTTELDAESINSTDLTTLRQLARKVAWLEQEIRDLRG